MPMSLSASSENPLALSLATLATASSSTSITKPRGSQPFGIQYEFHLEDAVDCPEWLVPFHVLKALAEEYSLELVYKKNFHEFVHEHVKNPEFAELMRKLGALGDGFSKSSISSDEWDAAYIYMAFVFKKNGPSQLHGEKNPKRVPAPISETEIGYVQFDS